MWHKTWLNNSIYLYSNDNKNRSYLIKAFAFCELSHEMLRRRKCCIRQRNNRFVVEVEFKKLFMLNSNEFDIDALISEWFDSRLVHDTRNSVFSSMIWSTLRMDLLSFSGTCVLRFDALIVRVKLLNELQLQFLLSRSKLFDEPKESLLLLLLLVNFKLPKIRVTLRDLRGDAKIPLELWVRKNVGIPPAFLKSNRSLLSKLAVSDWVLQSFFTDEMRQFLVFCWFFSLAILCLICFVVNTF